jgi:hypothetical protein
LNNYNLKDYLEQFRVNDYNNKNIHNVDNGLFIGRAGLGPIATRFGKLIKCFETKSLGYKIKTNKTYKTCRTILSRN